MYVGRVKPRGVVCIFYTFFSFSLLILFSAIFVIGWLCISLVALHCSGACRYWVDVDYFLFGIIGMAGYYKGRYKWRWGRWDGGGEVMGGCIVHIVECIRLNWILVGFN